MTDSPAPIEDRAANIKDTVRHIIDRAYEQMFEEFERLHGRNIHDDDMVTALRQLHELDILEDYADWADIDLREDDNTTLNPVVPDPGNAPSYKGWHTQIPAALDPEDAPSYDAIPPVTTSDGTVHKLDANATWVKTEPEAGK